MLAPEFLNSTRLLFDLQQGSKIAQSLGGCLEPEAIARRVTEGLIEKFGCAFARIWLVEPDRTMLKLVASAGMYTRLDGSFARVPMGAFKVGKIAQHRIPFLSNQLAEEAWVKDRGWAIANDIRGFAGYPLVAATQVMGVLAVFSQQTMAPEFLEVLQGLCTTVTIALETALRHQQEKQFWQAANPGIAGSTLSQAALSEQLAQILPATRLTLVGTERSLNPPLTCLFLQAAEALSQMPCIYGRFTYGSDRISLEAMIAAPAQPATIIAAFGSVQFAAACLGGSLQIQTGANPMVIQLVLTVPYPSCVLGAHVCVQCRSSVLQMAFTHLAYLAGLTVCPGVDASLPLITDDRDRVQSAASILWVATDQLLPKRINAKLDLSISPGQLRSAVEAVIQGETWGIEPSVTTELLSDREREIITLLAQGLRDRDIAHRLVISESTVKFHMNNVLAKLKAKTRYQALHQVITQGWMA